MSRIGRLISTSGTKHEIQSKFPSTKLSRPFSAAFETIQSSCKAYKTALEEQFAKSLRNRAKKLKKPPFGEQISGPAKYVPPKGI